MTENTTTTADLSPEVAFAMRLEGIFMPHARAQRDDFYGKSKRFVHYTSAKNALKISKYPPAKPGALMSEPLKAAWRGQ